MAALYWNCEVRVLGKAEAGIGEVKGVIEVKLQEDGFSDVRLNNLEVAGGKNGVWLSIAHFRIEDSRYWEVVMASGNSFDVAKNTVGEVVEMLHHLMFL